MSVGAGILRASYLPFLRWPERVTRQTLGADSLAGLAGAVVVLPQGVALAIIAGMPPQYGLYASIVPTIVAALFGSSLHLVAGPSTTASLILFAALSGLAEPGTARYVELALTLAFMAGAIELSLGLFRLGAVVNFVSNTVVVGYTAAVGVLIMTNQIGAFFGLGAHRTGGFLASLWTSLAALPHASGAVTCVSLVTLAAGLAGRHWRTRIPYMIPAILAGSFAAYALNAWAPGAVSTVGALPQGLPPLSLPSFDPATLSLLAPAAAAIAISALNEVVSIGRALAVRTHQRLDVNQEFVGQGLANLAGSFSSGYVVSGSFNRSALNYESGARTPLAAIFASLMLAAFMLFASQSAAFLPNAAMAASLEIVGWSLIDWRSLGRIWRTGGIERGILIATVGCALFLQVQAAILAGAAVSLLAYLYRTSNPTLRPRVPGRGERQSFVDPSAERPECPQLRFVRLDGSLYFGAVSAFREALASFARETPEVRHYAIVMRGVNFIDLAGADALIAEARRLEAAGGGLYLVNLKEAPSAFLEKGGFAAEFGADRIFEKKSEAVAAIYGRLDYGICELCSRRVFWECSRHGGPPQTGVDI
jgi:sulfate permease, SulP family